MPSQLALLPDEYYSANIPIEVIKRYTEIVYNQFKIGPKNLTNSKFPGLKEMQEVTGVSQKTLRDILAGERPSFSIDVCDKISMISDFSIDDIFEETLEWSKENPDSDWPQSYLLGAKSKKTQNIGSK